MQIKPNQNTSIDIDSTVAVEDDISNRLDRRISDVEMQFFGFEIKQDGPRICELEPRTADRRRAALSAKTGRG